MEQHALKKYKWLSEYQNYLLLGDIDGQNYNLYLNAVHFATPLVIRHLWQFEAVFLR